MKVCVVGGAGYIGSHTVYELIDAGHEVVVVDNLSTGLKEAVHKEALFYEGDITDFASLDKIVADESRKKPFDVVMHFAAKIVVPESVKNPSLYYYNNVEGVRTLLDVMVKHNIKNIIFSSTAAVYGEAKDGVCSEESETKPINPYGETKLTSEKMIGWFANAYDMNYCIFRYFNVAGAHKTLEIGLLRDNLTHIVPVTIQTALGIREKLTVFGTDYDTLDGTCVRDYVHVSDIAYAHVLGMKHIVEKNVSEIINLGSNQGFSVKNIINEVEKHYPVNYEYGARREGDPAKLIASNERAKEILGWMPKRDLSDIILSDLKFRIKHNKT
ncbi:MAG: UDP-glucose 4-epimerase GalE [Campylobacteraceae bacterium]|jgi:UDP-glucose 4-epimerase|nr:UDP-glucose 4-epimerase GalE [Campylobacteraceae bacterium]